jgi:hypothetical protein
MQNMSPELAVISSAGFRKRRRLGKAIFAAALTITALGALTWFNRGTLLRYAAEQWVVSDHIQPADAVLVLGGGIDTRPFAAAKDYRNGLVHKILGCGPSPSWQCQTRAGRCFPSFSPFSCRSCKWTE